jgi:hypothetical protein
VGESGRLPMPEDLTQFVTASPSAPARPRSSLPSPRPMPGTRRSRTSPTDRPLARPPDRGQPEGPRGREGPGSRRPRSTGSPSPRPAWTTSPSPCARWRRSPTRSARSSRRRPGPNGLRLRKVRVPIGVIGVIFEARPNVTVDCAVLCLKSGNASILRGGREIFETNRALGAHRGGPRGRGAPARLRPAGSHDGPGRAGDPPQARLPHPLHHPARGRGPHPVRRREQQDSRHQALHGVCFVYLDRARTPRWPSRSS